KEGEWIPNAYGGRENLAATGFRQALTEAGYSPLPEVQTIAEGSTASPGVSRPVSTAGLGAATTWPPRWRRATLHYFSRAPLFRQHHHGQLTFSMLYTFHENFMLPLSHDEVVHGKGSMVYKMPGDDWQRFANLRSLYLYMYTHPGTKLLF